MTVNHQKLIRLLHSGWQSWSWDYVGGKFKFPLYNYPPYPIEESAEEGLNIKIELKKPVKGWCSWYAFDGSISEKKILTQADWFQNNLPEFNYILIDGGWESHWGDWLHPDKVKFPNGLKEVTSKIKAMSLKPGIWIAPFLVTQNSKILKEHPNWLVSQNGKTIDGLRLTQLDEFLPYKRDLLDITNQEVLDYLDKVLNFLIKECKFELLKLDFLYSLYFNPKLTIEENDKFLTSFLLKIKQKYPNVYTIGCGCPLIPAIGVVDSMRIGPDTLIPGLQGVPIIKQLTNKYYYKKVIHNIHERMWTKKLWNLDPDALVCRKNTGLSDKEISELQKLIKECNGNIFLGDDLTKLPKDRFEKFIKPLL